MEVIKRNGKLEQVSFDKITNRIKPLCKNLDSSIDPILIAQKTVATMYNKITTTEIDEQSAKICANMCSVHPDYSYLGANILISNLHKTTFSDYGKVADILYHNYKSNIHVPLLSEQVYTFIKNNVSKINEIIDYNLDFNYDYFGFKTLERAYLQNIDKKVVERPQHMLMRIAIGLYNPDINFVERAYLDMAHSYYTHATPTLFNCGTNVPQCSSCFVLDTEDNLSGIYKTITDCAKISKEAGGIGISISKVRAKNSLIRGTNGSSNGLLPMCKVFNETARYVDQGGGKRNGSFAMYLEPWHADIYDFLDMKKGTGSETERARDLFTALYICDIFMERVKNDLQWSLMCPDQCPNLVNVYGQDFKKLYEQYEDNGLYVKQVSARSLFDKIMESQNETGGPYMVYKDHINNKTNHQNIGIIQGSNLCAEIAIHYSSSDYAVCTLGSLALPKFIDIVDGYPIFNYNKLFEMTMNLTRNLDRIIDINVYPVPEAKVGTLNHRPIGIGVQGLADVFIQMGYPFSSIEAFNMNKKIFEAIYYGALTMSNILAKEVGPYKLFDGCPFSKGILQFDMWSNFSKNTLYSDDEWTKLKNDIIQFGTRNSLLTALMPTASSAQILGNNECFEPITSNIYTRKTLAGTFMIVNKYLVKDLIKLNLWSDEMKQKILYYKGSIQKIMEIPKRIRELYMIASEIKQKVIMDMAISRGPYIDQTQSMNLFIDNVDFNKLRSAHFYAWSNGLKTGMYYLRTKPAVDPVQFTVSPELVKELETVKVCSRADYANCEACSA